MSDRVSERKRAAALARHYRDQEKLAIAEIARRLERAEATVKAYLYDPSDAQKTYEYQQGRRSRASESRACRGTKGELRLRRTFFVFGVAVQHLR